MIEKLAGSQGRVVGYEASGKLTDEDYQKFIPELETIIREQGKLRLLVAIKDFKGWTPKALWDDLKFDIKHYSDCERIALVGESQKEEWMAKLSKPFTKAEIKYFPLDQADQAWNWLREGI